MKSPYSAYLCTRVLLGSLDLASDLLVCVHLVLEEHLAWAALIGLFILTGFIASFLSVLIQRCRRGVPLTPYKYFLLSFKVHAEYGEAFFQSGPQLIIQLILFWTGVQTHDFQV